MRHIESVVLGQIVRAIGLRGEVKLLHTQDFWPDALQSAHLFLWRDESRRPTSVRRRRDYGAGTTAVTLDGVNDRNAAEALVGSELVLDTESLDVAPPESMRPFQVQGVRVFLPDGSLLGTVEDLMRLPGHDVFVVRDASREYLIPDAPHVVREFDLESGTMRIEPLPGLLEL